ncbi:hypothetical protein PVAP13_7KG342470 [Panicum virgatum]|uniref:Uncharacterized protein n=1 Tax=Panicum virgatum TaxID=38727 RepID=A0A8T0QI79_PANVG|nr:hypothetical protein PVAP13_7KG342470 [Panicum virgatum]
MTMKGLLRCVSTGACRVTPGAVAAPAWHGAGGKVPAGHVPVEVGAEGEETERFVVPAELLGRPPIAELLRRAAQEYATRAGARCASPAPRPRSAASSARSPGPAPATVGSRSPTSPWSSEVGRRSS